MRDMRVRGISAPPMETKAPSQHHSCSSIYQDVTFHLKVHLTDILTWFRKTKFVSENGWTHC